MKTKVGEIMSQNLATLPASATVREAAATMKARQIGCVIVERNGDLCGVVTDRDIVLRCIALGGDPDHSTLEGVCSPHLATLSPGDEIGVAVELMRK
jgi:CBS domain-containing protein